MEVIRSESMMLKDSLTALRQLIILSRWKRGRSRKRDLTYINTSYTFELTVSLDEARTVSTENLLNSSPRKLYCRCHYLLVFAVCSRSRPIIVILPTFKLTHLLKSIVITSSVTYFVIFWVWTLVSVVVVVGHSTVILAYLGSSCCLGHVCRVGGRCLLLTRHASSPRLIHCLYAIVKPRVKHLSRLFWAMAPRLIFVHYLSLSLNL